MAFLKFFKGEKTKLQKKSEKEGKRKSRKKTEEKKPREKPGKKKAAPLKVEEPQEPKEEKRVEKKKLEKESDKEKTTAKPPKGKAKIAHRVLLSPQITEKATDLQNKNQYIFKVAEKANKLAVREAIKEIYGVDVLKVRMINVKSKRRRLGRSTGFRGGYKKAIVSLKQGQSIEVLPR